MDKTLHSSAGGPGSIPGQGTRSHMHAVTKSSCATTKEPTCWNQDPVQPKNNNKITLCALLKVVSALHDNLRYLEGIV